MAEMLHVYVTSKLLLFTDIRSKIVSPVSQCVVCQGAY